VPLAPVHVGKANAYITDVLSGKIAACTFVKAACERQVRDLADSESDIYPYRFDTQAAERVCRVIEKLPHIKGPLAGRRIVLEPWQCFTLTTVFGWLSKLTGKRRFRRVYIEVPKGNGKSALSSGVAVYMLTHDGEAGVEIYSAATTRDQSKIVFGVAQAMLRKTPELVARAKLDVREHTINKHDMSWFRPLSSEADSLEGINPHFVCIDELHAHKSRELYDNIVTAAVKRDQPLIWSITTAGSNRAGICYEVRSYTAKLLTGTAKDEQSFGIIYSTDEADDWANQETWVKANPNWGVSVYPDAIALEAHEAIQLASKQAAFKTKHLNVWVNADFAWLDMRKLEACVDAKLAPEQFTGEHCNLGLDLSSKLDLACSMKLFMKGIESKRHYYAFGLYWLPEVTIEKASNSQYQGWNVEGRLNACPGETNDFDVIEESLRKDVKDYNAEIDFDEWRATDITNHFISNGVSCVEIRRNDVRFFDAAMRELEIAIIEKRFHYDGDPILTWGLSNVVCHRDAVDNIFPRKERPENKIDPAIALLMALGRARTSELTSESGVSAFGVCEKCSTLSIGKYMQDKLVFRCKSHPMEVVA